VPVDQTIAGSDGALIQWSCSQDHLLLTYRLASPDHGSFVVFVAIRTDREIGSAIVPFSRDQDGSTVFLPFNADLLIRAAPSLGLDQPYPCEQRRWEHWKWSELRPSTCRLSVDGTTWVVRVPLKEVGGRGGHIDCAVYAKDFSGNHGWGNFLGCNDPSVEDGPGDKYIPNYIALDLSTGEHQARPRLNGSKLRLYQLFVRLFGNTNETRRPNGTMAENGVGKFNDINDVALNSLHELGFTHVWLTGVLQQATGTDYTDIGAPADDPDLLKGIAGSPYAIKDYFDVCPDYAVVPETRLAEFAELVHRVHRHGMKVLIDFVPNHVARSHNSDIRPEVNFGTRGNGGAGDDKSVFFSPQNNFFYLAGINGGPPLRLPTVSDNRPVSATCQAVAALHERGNQKIGGRRSPLPMCDGLFEGETDHGKVTGNNVVSWTPSLHDWYETVKLNYGFDFSRLHKDVREYPGAIAPDTELPDTWRKMDAVLAYWQSLGVDGFRCDMAHMVPPEFWKWAVHRARTRDAVVVFIGEAYDNDPAKVPGSDPVITKLNAGKSNVMFDLLDAGFDAVYDDPTYRIIKQIYEGQAWANDIDDAQPEPFIFENSLRYVENHDEVRLGAKSQWGGHGIRVGIPVAAVLYGLSRGAIMLYNGQEVGEPGEGVEGFGRDDARTSIFDYWSMPELVKWVNGDRYDGARLSDEQKQFRAFYGRLVNLLTEPALRDGSFFPLNRLNRDNAAYGRLPDETASGHWLYCFVRYDCTTGQTFVIAANLHPSVRLENVFIRLSDFMVGPNMDDVVTVLDRLNSPPLCEEECSVRSLRAGGLPIAPLPPLSACYLELRRKR
jgi:glycosidase